MGRHALALPQRNERAIDLARERANEALRAQGAEPIDWRLT